MSVYLPSSSTFKTIENPLSKVVQRELSQNTRGEDFWGWVIFPFTLAMTPISIVADMIIGVAHIVFEGVKGELDQEKFWKICDQNFFIYPFQQVIFFVFSIIGSISYYNYVDGYLVGQQCVIEFSNETYQGPSEIFNRVYYHIREFQPFPGLHLSNQDRIKLNTFKEEAARFSYLFSQKEKIPDSEDLELGPILLRMKEAEAVYRIFTESPPSSMREVTEEFNSMKKIIKGSDAIGLKEKTAVLDYLHCAHDTVCSFFQIPYIYRMRLLAPVPQLPGIRV
jgi:hypothetical protein